MVLKYELVPDALNDVISLYVDFPLGYAETSSAVRSKMVESNDFDSGYADPSQLKAVSFKQRENGSVVQMSQLRVATTWDEAVNYTGPSLEPEDLTKPIYADQKVFQNIIPLQQVQCRNLYLQKEFM